MVFLRIFMDLGAESKWDVLQQRRVVSRESIVLFRSPECMEQVPFFQSEPRHDRCGAVERRGHIQLLPYQGSPAEGTTIVPETADSRQRRQVTCAIADKTWTGICPCNICSVCIRMGHHA